MLDLSRMEHSIIYSHERILHPKVDFHLHTGYEIYFLISGDVNYFVEKNIYPLQYGDLIVTNSDEIHKPSFQSDQLYERICLEFDPALIRSFHVPGFDLLDCFTNRPNGTQNKITLTQQQIQELLTLFDKIGQLNDTIPGKDILKFTYLVELLVYLNTLTQTKLTHEERTNTPEKLVPILEYINNHLDSNLDLKDLERTFFIDRFYLSKLFKQSTGSSIHKYIIYKRIAKAKMLLSEGWSVTEACAKCGFNDYSNFLKMFKRIVGVSPGKIKKTKG